MNEQMMEKQIVSTPRQIHADTYTDARGERDENESVIRSNFFARRQNNGADTDGERDSERKRARENYQRK